MRRRRTILLSILSLFFCVSTAWANSSSLQKMIAVPFREKVEKIILFDKIYTDKGDLLTVEVVLSFNSSPKTQYSSYQSILHSNGKYTLVYSDTGDIGPRALYFNEAICKKLAFNRYKYQLRTGGKTDILNRLKTPNLSLPKEDIWALKQLGVNIPSTVKELAIRLF